MDALAVAAWRSDSGTGLDSLALRHHQELVALSCGF
jgi:hypothetical protein